MRQSRISLYPWRLIDRRNSPSPALREREGASPQGWEAEGLLCLDDSQYRLDDPVGVAENVVVPKSDHLPALALEPSWSARVPCIVRMLTAIDLDHKPVFGAGEIDNETTDWVLSPELVHQQAAIAQSRPHASLGIGRGLPQSASFPVGHRRMLSDLGKQSADVPSPASVRSAPSPAVRERGYSKHSFSPSSASEDAGGAHGEGQQKEA